MTLGYIKLIVHRTYIEKKTRKTNRALNNYLQIPCLVELSNVAHIRLPHVDVKSQPPDANELSMWVNINGIIPPCNHVNFQCCDVSL